MLRLQALMVLATAACLAAPAAFSSGGARGRAVAHGAELFHASGCEHCHGADEAGGSLGPDLRGVGRALTPAQIERQIRMGGGAGRNAATGNMPGFGEVLSKDEIADLVAYLGTRRARR